MKLVIEISEGKIRTEVELLPPAKQPPTRAAVSVREAMETRGGIHEVGRRLAVVKRRAA